MFSYDYNMSSYLKYLSSTSLSLLSKDLANLMNGNNLQNLPSLNITSNDATVNMLQQCTNGPIYMGNEGSDFSCRQMCGSSARTFVVGNNETVVSNGEVLRPGTWCMLNPPDCNLNTTYAVATINSVICRSKHPRVYGGDTGNLIVACNNEHHFNIQNILWDNLNNRRVTQFSDMQDVDELLPNGLYRFTCRFGDDDYGNQYISHPIDRVHPTRNYCSKDLFFGHRSIRELENNICDCGNYQDTRVRNKLPNDPTSTCTSCFHERREAQNISTASSECFTLFSSYDNITNRLPCMPNQFLRETVQCSRIDVSCESTTKATFPLHPILTGNRGIRQDSPGFGWT